MKSIMIFAVAAMLLVAPIAVQNANAQIELTLGGGMNAPMGDYGDESKAGYALTTGLGFRFVPYAAIGAELNYNGNKASDEATLGMAPGYDLSSSILQYSAVAKFLLPVGNHSLYTKGSLGNYRGSAKLSGPDGDLKLTTSALGFGVGGGFLVNSGKSSSLFVDVTYHTVTFDDADDATNYFAFTAGALIKFDLSKPKLRDELQDDLDKLRD